MDTKQKTRPASQKRTSRSAASNTKSTRRSAEDESRRRRSAQEPEKRRSASAPEQRRRRPEEQKRRPNPVRTAQPQPEHRSIKTDAPEMVFKPTQETPYRRDPETARRSEIRRRSAKRTKARTEEKKRIGKRPEVVYTQPAPVNLNRLLLRLAVVLAVVFAIVLGLSVFFRVEQVVVYGNHAYTPWMVQEASGIEGGEKLLTLNTTRASGKIIAALPYVENVRIGINLPDTVNIYIKEIDVAYAIQSQDGIWWLMTSGGKVVEQIDSGAAGSYTKILGVELQNPVVGEAALAMEVISAPEETQAPEAESETIALETTEPVVLVTGQDRLNAALLILATLERNGIVGQAASIDVTSLSNMELWYGQQFQVKLGDTSEMEKKISWMKSAIAQRKEYDMGVLDVSFVTWEDQVGYTPFE